jgi:hypothetical protein
MNKAMKKLAVVLAVLTAAAVTTARAQMELSSSYLNAANPLGISHSMGGLEFGDRITMSGPTGWWPLTDFYFEYFSQLTPAVGKEAVFRIYANNGPVTDKSFGKPTPGSLLFDSSIIGPIPLEAGYKTVEIHGGGQSVLVPQSYTWTVEFKGLGQSESAGLLVNGGPEVGESAGDFWARDAQGDWGVYLIDNGNIAANFTARAVAIPEPGVLHLILLAGAGWLGMRVIRRRS